MSPITRGFRRRHAEPAAGLPPGQYLTLDFPVLSAGPTPHVPLDEWRFEIGERSWSWDEFQDLPSESITVDIHCVTSWSKLETHWEGVSVDTLLEDVEPGPYVMAHSYGGYTTNLPIEDVTDGKAWVAYDYDGRAARVRARRPGAPARPAPVLLEEREVGARPGVHGLRRAGLLGVARLPRPRRPLARAALPR